MGVAATEKRLHSWQVSDRDDDYFPLSIAELERNLRAVVVLKKQRAEKAEAAAAPAPAAAEAAPAEASVDAPGEGGAVGYARCGGGVARLSGLLHERG
jgi:hypothetical protein